MDGKQKFLFSGLWVLFISGPFSYGLSAWFVNFTGSEFTWKVHLVVWIIAMIPVLIVFIQNAVDYSINGKRDFSLHIFASTDPQSDSREKLQVMRKPVPAKLLTEKPRGEILGKHHGQYFYVPIERSNLLHTLIIGAPGSGKSSGPLLSSLIPQFMEKEPEFCSFVIDVKPELAKKSVELKDNPSVEIFDIIDRSAWGWDIYYRLNKESSDDEILSELDIIFKSLISTQNEKNAFFVHSAQSVAKGLCLYYFRKGIGFVDTITAIMSKDLASHIKEVLADKAGCPDNSKARMYLARFDGKDSEAFQDVELTLEESMEVFLSNTVRWACRDNPKKISPTDITEHNKSIFLCIPEVKLDEYAGLMRLFLAQTFKAVEARPDVISADSNIKPIWFVIDELPRLKRIPQLTSFLATCRSRMASCCLVVQGYDQLLTAYGDEARSIMTLCEVISVLSVKDNETAKMLCDFIPEYREEKVSFNRTTGSRASGSKQTVSREYRSFKPSDLMRLRATGKVMVLVEGEVYWIDQCRYYQEPAMVKRYEELKAINEIK